MFLVRSGVYESFLKGCKGLPIYVISYLFVYLFTECLHFSQMKQKLFLNRNKKNYHWKCLLLQGLPLIKISIRHFQNTPDSLYMTDFYTQQSRDNRVCRAFILFTLQQNQVDETELYVVQKKKSTGNFSVFQYGVITYIFGAVNENLVVCEKFCLRHFSEEYLVILYLRYIFLARSLFSQKIFFSIWHCFTFHTK